MVTLYGRSAPDATHIIRSIYYSLHGRPVTSEWSIKRSTAAKEALTCYCPLRRDCDGHGG